jgi:hypothetical protein
VGEEKKRRRKGTEKKRTERRGTKGKKREQNYTVESQKNTEAGA